MIRVIGNSPRKVELKDLKDCVYYKQQKVFSDSEYNSSKDLQRELKKGSLIITSRVDERDAQFNNPGVVDIKDVQAPQNAAEINKIFKKITDLESTLKSIPDRAPANSTIVALSEKIKELEHKVQTAGSPLVNVDLSSEFRKLEEKIEKSSKSDELFKRLESILENMPASGGVRREAVQVTRPDEVYVPSVSVEDANTHIKLDVRSIEKSDSVNDSLKKLRELKNKK